MLRVDFFRSKVLIWSVLAAVTLLFFPHGALAQVPAGSMTGFIYAADMESPVEGAVVKLQNVATGKEFQSSFTEKTGLYKIKGIPEGRYVVGVSSQKGDFNFDYQLIVKANDTAKLSLALKPDVPGAGTAAQPNNKDKKDKKKGALFWSPAGVAVIVATTAFLTFGVYKIFIEEEEKSPSKK